MGGDCEGEPMSKPKLYGDPYRQLKAANLPKKQYQQIKGQIKAGRADDAMRGLMRLMERRNDTIIPADGGAGNGQKS